MAGCGQPYAFPNDAEVPLLLNASWSHRPLGKPWPEYDAEPEYDADKIGHVQVMAKGLGQYTGAMGGYHKLLDAAGI